MEADLVVIGGGPAGMAAAVAAWQGGIRRIAVLERQDELGGILKQCIHNGFGLSYFGAEMTGPEYAERLQARLAGCHGVRVELSTLVYDLTKEREILAMSGSGGITRWRAKAVILAMGCRERPRGAINIPGPRPAGIYTAGTVQNILNLQGLLPGRSAVIIGSGDIGLIMARRLTLEGIPVRAVIEMQPYPGGLARNLAQCIQDYRIPLYLGHTVTGIHGRDRVSGVTVARLAEAGAGPPDSFHFDCDTLVLSCGLLPEVELARLAKITVDPLTGGPSVDGWQQTSVNGIFACGNISHVHDLADDASTEGESAGRAAAAFIRGELRGEPSLPLRLAGNIRTAVPQRLIPGRENLLYLRVRQPAEEMVLKCGPNVVDRFRRVKPAESLRVKLPQECLHPAADGCLHLSLVVTESGVAGRSTAMTPADAGYDPDGLTCIVCPLGCQLKASRDGDDVQVEGAGCRRGVDHARTETLAPRRVLTTTVMTRGREFALLPVCSLAPLPKHLLPRAMDELRGLTVDRPVRIGQVVKTDLAGTGIPAVASRSL